jgi:hypothetical protein
MKGSRAWSEFENVDEIDRFYFETFYHSVGGITCDFTDENNGANSVTDPQGDASYSFVDIVGGNIGIVVTPVNNPEVDNVLDSNNYAIVWDGPTMKDRR